jgi:energy-converting hydrogenase Eha subunit H
MARARIRVQLTDARSVVFDRIVVTDTVVGENGIAPAELAARVAREVLVILRPHLRRSVPLWQ